MDMEINAKDEIKEEAPKSRGGARPGAGRKKRPPPGLKKWTKYKYSIRECEKWIGGKVDDLLHKQINAARGGITTIREVWRRSGDFSYFTTQADEKGKMRRVKFALYPHLKPDATVLVSRVVTIHPPSHTACSYLLDRVMGKPISRNAMIEATKDYAPEPKVDQEELLRELLLLVMEKLNIDLPGSATEETAQDNEAVSE